MLALLTPRIELASVPGINSGLRLDVLIFLFLCFIPLLEKISIRYLLFILLIILIGLFQIVFLDSSITRYLVGTIYYTTFITFCMFKNKILTDDLIFICKWFLLINAILHCFDMFFQLSVDHNYSARYGIFNQHFAFATTIFVCYYCLYYFKKNTLFINLIFIVSFILSGSRGMIFSASIFFFFINIKSFKYFNYMLFGLILSIIIVSGTLIYNPDNIHLNRLILLFKVGTDLLFEGTSVLTDPALNVRMSNIYNYFYHIENTTFPILHIILGGGPYSFLDYSIQYNKPGHFDNTAFRLLSEYGLLAIMFLLFLLSKQSTKSFSNKLYIMAVLLGGVVSEAILTLKVGHLFFLSLLYFKEQDVFNTKNNT